MRNRLLQDDAKGKGWLLEGYPRTAFQAEELDFLLDDLGQRLDWAIYLEVPESVMMNRCLGRSRSAIEEHSHTLTANPKVNTSVKNSRPDDQPEIVQRRLNLFYERTIPILEYYGYRNRLLTIKGDQSPEQVEQEILQNLQI